jgi:hypothetical protein
MMELAGKTVVPVPPLAVARVPERVRVPEVVIGPPENERPVVPPEALTEVTVPPPPPLEIQAPLIAKQPAVMFTPLARVEEAVADELIAPVPVMVRPFDDARPPVETPPVKLDVALTVLMSVPPAMVRPPVEILRSVVKIPPLKLEVAVEVLRREPPETVRPFEDRTLSAFRPPANVEVAVVPEPRTSIDPPITVEVAVPPVPVI